MRYPDPVARRFYELTEPVALVAFFSQEPADAMAALGYRGYWDGYFAGRAAPLGPVPAEVVHAAFYSFAEGEAARHIPRVWETATPEAAHQARQQGCVAALRRILGDLVEAPGFARAADILATAATSAPTEGRVMYAALRTLPVPEAHVLNALASGVYPAESFGRIHHLPKARLAAVMAGLRERGLVDGTGHLTDAGGATKERVESLTDVLAEAPYLALEARERDELAALLEPVAARLEETGSR